jgi:hypothetical protein
MTAEAPEKLRAETARDSRSSKNYLRDAELWTNSAPKEIATKVVADSL